MTDRKKYSYRGRRLPAIILYKDDLAAKKIVEKYWRHIMGPKYAFADVVRQLIRHEADRITEELSN